MPLGDHAFFFVSVWMAFCAEFIKFVLIYSNFLLNVILDCGHLLLEAFTVNWRGRISWTYDTLSQSIIARLNVLMIVLQPVKMKVERFLN